MYTLAPALFQPFLSLSLATQTPPDLQVGPGERGRRRCLGGRNKEQGEQKAGGICSDHKKVAAGWGLGRAQREGVGSGHEPAWPRAKLRMRNITLRLPARQDMLEKQGGDSRQQ